MVAVLCVSTCSTPLFGARFSPIDLAIAFTKKPLDKEKKPGFHCRWSRALFLSSPAWLSRDLHPGPWELNGWVDGGDGREWKFSEIQDRVWHKRNMAGGKLSGIAMSKELSPFTYGDRASSGFQANDDDNNQPSSLANKLIFLAGGGYGDSKPIRSAVSSFLNLWARHGLLDPATSGRPKLGPRDSP